MLNSSAAATAPCRARARQERETGARGACRGGAGDPPVASYLAELGSGALHGTHGRRRGDLARAQRELRGGEGRGGGDEGGDGESAEHFPGLGRTGEDGLGFPSACMCALTNTFYYHRFRTVLNYSYLNPSISKLNQLSLAGVVSWCGACVGEAAGKARVKGSPDVCRGRRGIRRELQPPSRGVHAGQARVLCLGGERRQVSGGRRAGG